MPKSTRRSFSSISKVKLVVMEKPVKPVKNGKNRCKFPSSKDCCVRFGIFDHANNEVRCKNAIQQQQQQSMILTSKRNGPKFVLELTCITRHAINGSSITDVPLDSVLLQRPLNCWKNGKHADSEVGFWFRFFGKSCRFHVKIVLKAVLQNKQQNESKIIDTVELDIINLETPTNKGCSLFTYKRLRTTSLYNDENMVIMDKLQSLYDKCCWQECKVMGDMMVLKLGPENKSDQKVCIMLLLSKVACQQGKPKDAKQLIKNALDMLPTNSNNKDLLTGRAYTCLSIAHQHDGTLGSAEECLRIARTKLINFVPCEDTGDFNLQQGKLLLGFIFQIPSLHKELFNEAKAKFEKAVHHYEEMYRYRLNKIGTWNKIYVSQLYIAITLLLKDDKDDNAVVAESTILMVTEVQEYLTSETMCVLSFARAILANKLGDVDAAHSSGKSAFHLAEKNGFLDKQWIENYLGMQSGK